MKKIIVVGGVAGGMSFATRYRRLNMDDHIIVFDKGPYVSFANCGLPYYISGEIPSRRRLLVVKEDELVNRFNLDIKTSSEVTAINPKEKMITYVKDNESYFESYDELILSTGAKPFIPDIKGLHTMPHFELRNIPNMDQIMSFIKTQQPQHIAILGAGFIGLEVAENLHKKGIKVTIIEKSRQLLPNMDVEMSVFAEEELRRHQIDYYLDDEIIEIKDRLIKLRSNALYEIDALILSTGVLPENKLAKDAGLTLGLKGGVLVDGRYQTSNKHIYAVGDAIIVKHQISNEDALIPLASPANRQGRQLADILSGIATSNKGSIGTSIVRLFDLSFASTGLNEKQLKGRNYGVVHLQANHHASYYPGATEINLKVIFDKDTENILGAQAVGQNGVDKRIDIISTAIKGGIKVIDLQELELTYAPPFGSAKDIVNLAGYVAQNILLGLSQTIQWYDVEKRNGNDYIFLDVRNEMERLGHGYIDDSMHIDIDELYQRYQEIPKNKKIIVYCESGTRSYNAERILRAKGYDVYNLDGSYSIYGKMKGRKFDV